MKQFTAERTADTRDEIWLVQHPPTYTQGQAGKPEHLLHAHNIPVVQDRSRRADHLSRPRPDRRLPAARLAPLEDQCARTGAPDGAGRDRLARRIRRGRAGPRGCARRVCGRCQDRLARLEDQARLLLSRAGVECGHGPDPVRQHQPVRPCRDCASRNAASSASPPASKNCKRNWRRIWFTRCSGTYAERLLARINQPSRTRSASLLRRFPGLGGKSGVRQGQSFLPTRSSWFRHPRAQKFVADIECRWSCPRPGEQLAGDRRILARRADVGT